MKMFLVAYRRSKWQVLEPGGKITTTDTHKWEAKCFPGGKVGAGDTKKAATHSLLMLISDMLYRQPWWWEKVVHGICQRYFERLLQVWDYRLLTGTWVKTELPYQGEPYQQASPGKAEPPGEPCGLVEMTEAEIRTFPHDFELPWLPGQHGNELEETPQAPQAPQTK